MLRGQQFGVGIERALGQLSREPDKSGVGEKRFYKRLIAKADERFDRHLAKRKG